MPYSAVVLEFLFSNIFPFIRFAPDNVYSREPACGSFYTMDNVKSFVCIVYVYNNGWLQEVCTVCSTYVQLLIDKSLKTGIAEG